MKLADEIRAAKRHLVWLKKQQPKFKTKAAKIACADSIKIVKAQIARMAAELD